MNEIKVDYLTKKYGKKVVLKDLNLTLTYPSITGLIGRNGSGKTTLLNLLVGYKNPTCGKIKVFGENPFDSLFVSANTIFVDDRMQIPNTLNLNDILIEMGRFYPNWDSQLATNLLNYFDLPPNSLHQNLSKGKKSVFNMIVGLSAYAFFTVFDEPMTGMDEAVRKDMYRALLKNYLEKPRIMIISSHHLQEVEYLLENLILLDEGNLMFEGDIEAFRSYAIGLTGKTAVLEPWAQTKTILHKEQVGIDDTYVVIKNDVSQVELDLYSEKQSRVETSDLLIYLTNKHRGVIDDVFKTDRIESSK